jgi:hypothetical protein
MKEKILKAAYDKGLYSQGTPDSWDEEALYQFGKYLIDECIDAVKNADTKDMVYTTYDQDRTLGVKERCAKAIERKFE